MKTTTALLGLFLLLVMSCSDSGTGSSNTVFSATVVDENGRALSGVAVHYSPAADLANPLTSNKLISNSSNTLQSVTINSFSGNTVAMKVELVWVTSSESNNAGFILVRDGVEIASYLTNSSLVGNGTVSQYRTYRYTDSLMQSGVYKYRLRSQDSSGVLHNYNNEITVFVGGTVIANPPTSFALDQNYPNPIEGSSQIPYTIARVKDVNLDLIDMEGTQVETLVNQRQVAGRYQCLLESREFIEGVGLVSAMASGIYTYRIKADSFNAEKKLVVKYIDFDVYAKAQPRALTDNSGKFTIDKKWFGLGSTIPYLNDQGVSLGEYKITNDVSLVFIKEGYISKTQKVNVNQRDVTIRMQKK